MLFIWFYVLFSDVISSSAYIASNGIINEFEIMLMEAVMALNALD